VILSIMFQVSLQVLFVDPVHLSLKSFNLDMPTLPTQHRLSLSSMECAATGTFDVCYPTKLIEKAAVIQKLIKLIVDEAIKKGDANVAE
jgi:hypothetical protein